MGRDRSGEELTWTGMPSRSSGRGTRLPGRVTAAAPQVTAAALVIFMTAISELTLSALLWSAGNETIGVQIFSLQYEGNSTAAAALSVLALTAVAILVLAADRLGRSLPPGTLPWRVG